MEQASFFRGRPAIGPLACEYSRIVIMSTNAYLNYGRIVLKYRESNHHIGDAFAPSQDVAGWFVALVVSATNVL